VAIPTTPPVRKAMRMPSERPSGWRAAAATRTLALTARLMPRYPMAAEKRAPTMKKTERPILTFVSPGRTNSRAQTMTTKMPRVLN